MSKNVPAASGAGPVPTVGATDAQISNAINMLLRGILPGVEMAQAFPPALPTTPLAISDLNVGNYTTANMLPAGVLEGYRSAIVVPNSYTQAPYPVCNYSAYVSQNNTATGASVVPYFSLAAFDTDAPNSSIYGANHVMNNNAHHFGAAFGVEYDFDIIPVAGGGAPSGSVYGISLKGGSTILPTGEVMGIDIWPLNVFTMTNPWIHGIFTRDGSISGAFADIGTIAATANPSTSPPISFRGRTAGGVLQRANILGDEKGTLHVYTNTPGTTGTGALIVGDLTSTLDANAIFRAHAATDQNLEIRGKINLTTGIVLESLNDALNTLQGLEIIADAVRFTVNNINVNGTAGVTFTGSPTASFQVINGIVVHQ